MTEPRKPKTLSREEDYRDYEDRNLRDGWPYSDGSGSASQSPENRGYGDTSANFDEEPDRNFIVDAADQTGLERAEDDTTGPLPTDRIDSDELEAVITEQLELRGVDIDSIDVQADGGTVTLEGSVETIPLARHLEAIVRSIPGVVEVQNNLRTTGVDAHIPGDDE
ncbi:BON domain-containing protein [Rhizobium paranaense]|uniref:HSP20 family molecular chaperone IbpA n=1 Tax=Rhizobium paranaense TaxID=1650438 RepID=A0A7W8XUX7_9HYPH|nr:BON domain-containing protein [Rhizobium paranaense]MBB5576016.1 HSP20 family molecular chaperone IbpA [Rhizobium paranaense]